MLLPLTVYSDSALLVCVVLVLNGTSLFILVLPFWLSTDNIIFCV